MEVARSLLYEPASEADLLVSALARYPERTAINLGTSQVRYRELADNISRYCQALSSLGLRAGDRVGLLSGNRVEVIYLNYAFGLLGCCLVPLHPRGSLDDHEYVVRDADLAALVFDADQFSERGAQLATLGIKMLAMGEAAGCANIAQVARAYKPQALDPPRLQHDAVVRLSYSGGTTGEPKAIMGTVRSLLTKTQIQLTDWEWPSEIRQLVVAPLSHAGGAMILPTLVRGGSLFVLPTFDPAEVLRTIEKDRITCTLLIPTMIAALLDHPGGDSFDCSSLELIYYGASPIAPSRLRQGIARFGSVFFQFYGQTEAPMTVCVMRRDEHIVDDEPRLASCGRPVPWVRVELLGEDGLPVDDGAPGEICIQGPLVMNGYWNKPEQTREALKDGWLHSGDVATRLPDGFLQIVDRKKDMIISGGFNVFAREVEDVLADHPAVANCAVIGVPHPRWGEAVKAVVVLRNGYEPCADELISLVKSRKGSIQAPKFIQFVSDIPMTALGKPNKKVLRQEATCAAEVA